MLIGYHAELVDQCSQDCFSENIIREYAIIGRQKTSLELLLREVVEKIFMPL